MTDPRYAFMQRVEAAWRERAATAAGQRLTRLHVHVAAKLAWWRSATVRHRQLARAARCSTRTVRRALARLHALGLLSWTRQTLACRGWRAMVANSYRFNASSIDYQELRSSANLSPPGTVRAPVRAAAPVAGSDLLAARRAVLAARWQAARQTTAAAPIPAGAARR